MDQVQIQYQDIMGNWITQQVVNNIQPYIIQCMQQVSSTSSGKRVRAVDSSGRVIDIL
jgi:hypothetical protein